MKQFILLVESDISDNEVDQIIDDINASIQILEKPLVLTFEIIKKIGLINNVLDVGFAIKSIKTN